MSQDPKEIFAKMSAADQELARRDLLVHGAFLSEEQPDGTVRHIEMPPVQTAQFPRSVPGRNRGERRRNRALKP